MTGRSAAIAAAAIALIAICVVRVAATARYYGPTNDETAHIAAGYDVIHGIPGYDIEHPPLARAIFAWPLRNAPSPAVHDPFGFRRGTALLNSGDYLTNLVRARAGNLIFVVILLLATFLWTRHEFGDGTAIIALLLVSTLPPILAHGSIATTDLAATAMLPAALYATVLWLESPTIFRTILLGLAIGAGLLVKFSFPVFYGMALVFLLPARLKREHLRPAAIAIGISALLVWGGYRFTFGTLATTHPRGVEMAHLGLDDWVADMPMPAPLFFGGLLDVKLHNDRGHVAYLFGTWERYGRWYYFPALMLFATPIAFLILAAIGAWKVIRTRQWVLALLPLAALLPAIASHMNLGIRHVMPAYPLMAMIGAVSIRRKWILIPLLAWQVVPTSLAHPNYLGWMNEPALGHPERIALDSNLDWGQDVLPLARKCRELGVQRIGLFVNSNTDLDAIGMPPHYALDPKTPSRGWVAVSIDPYLFLRNADPRNFAWISAAKRLIRVGRSITLYELP